MRTEEISRESGRRWRDAFLRTRRKEVPNGMNCSVRKIRQALPSPFFQQSWATSSPFGTSKGRSGLKGWW